MARALIRAAVAAALTAGLVALAYAQPSWVPQYATPYGLGPGHSGLGSSGPDTAGKCWMSNGPSSPPSFQPCGLATSVQLYISTSGDDAKDCSSTGNACATLGRTAAIVNALPTSVAVTINVAAGTYRSGAIFNSGIVTVQGASSASTSIDDSADFATVGASHLARVTVTSISLSNTTTAVLYAEERGMVFIGSDVVLGLNPENPAAIMLAQNDGAIYGFSSFTINGAAGSIWNLQRGYARLFGDPPVITFTNSPVIGAVVVTENTSVLKTGGAQFSGAASITTQYGLTGNSTLDQEQNVSEFPGAQGQLTGGSTYYNGGLQFTGVISGSSGTTALLTASGISSGLGYLGVGQRIVAASGATYMKISSLGTGTGKNGTYNLTCTSSCSDVASETMLSSSIYPCVSEVGLCPNVIAAPTGLGTGGTAIVSNDSWGGDYGGIVTLTSGSGSTSSTGILYVLTHSAMSNCVAVPSPAGGLLASVGAVTGTSSGRFYIQLQWSNGTTLATSTTYGIAYTCH